MNKKRHHFVLIRKLGQAPKHICLAFCSYRVGDKAKLTQLVQLSSNSMFSPLNVLHITDILCVKICGGFLLLL